MSTINTIGFYMVSSILGLIVAIFSICFIVSAWQENAFIGILVTIALIGILLSVI
jgi:hypothetical protein